MNVNKDGSIDMIPITHATRIFTETKNITSIFIDNAIKVEGGYFLSKKNMSTTTKKLINYLKQNK